MKFLPPPGPARTRQLALLGVLLIGAAYALSRLGTGSPARPPLPASNIQTTAPPAQKAAGQSSIPQPLQLDKLEPVEELPATTRDPFRFGMKPPPPAPPMPTYVLPPPPPSRPVAPPTPAVRAITLKFIGRVVTPDRRIVATLTDGRAVFRAMEGDVVDGQYRLVKIGEESLVIEYLDGKGRTTLPMRGM